MTQRLVLALGLAGCFPSPQPAYAPPPQQQDQAVTGCQMMLGKYDEAWCAPDTQGTYASDAASHEGQTVSDVFRTQLQAARAQCTAPSLAPALAKLDGCIATIAELEQRERSAQQARLPDVRRKEPAIRSNPKYAHAIRELEDRGHAARVASDNLKIARDEHNTDLDSYQRAYDRADAEVKTIEAELRELFRSYDVDPRDAHRVGLW